MIKRILKIAIITIIIAIVLLFGYTMVYSALTTNAFRQKVKVSREEKALVKKIERECNCEVKYEHNYNLISGKSQGRSIKKELLIILRNYENYKRYNIIKGKDYEKFHNTNAWCSRDTLFLKNKTREIIEDFISTSDYSHLYDRIVLEFSILRNIGKDEILDQEMCRVYTYYHIASKQIKFSYWHEPYHESR